MHPRRQAVLPAPRTVGPGASGRHPPHHPTVRGAVRRRAAPAITEATGPRCVCGRGSEPVVLVERATCPMLTRPFSALPVDRNAASLHTA